MARLRILRTGDPVHEKIFKANSKLSEGTLESISFALKLYTELLYTDSPGHLCALLNRSLAYVALGYPELAVVDAYRAAQICHEARRVHHVYRNIERAETRAKVGMPRCTWEWETDEESFDGPDEPLASIVQATHKYLATEKLHVQSGAPWSVQPTCWIRRPFVKWLQGSLASIFLGDYGVVAKKRPIFEVLEAKAVFRIVGALWMIGDGAISDAMGLISDVLRLQKGRLEYWVLTWDEIDEFDDLGNAMLNETLGKMSRCAEQTKETLLAKKSMVNRVIYPWNSHHPRMEDYGARERIQMLTDSATKSLCTVRYDEATFSTPFRFILVGNKPIEPKQRILEETTLLQATTPAQGTYWICDTCCARIIPSPSVPSKDDSCTSSVDERINRAVGASMGQNESDEEQLSIRSETSSVSNHSLHLESPQHPPNASKEDSENECISPGKCDYVWAGAYQELIDMSSSPDFIVSLENYGARSGRQQFTASNEGQEEAMVDSLETADIETIELGDSEAAEHIDPALLSGAGAQSPPTSAIDLAGVQSDFCGCPACRLTAYCSFNCWRLSEEPHHGLCCNNTQETLETRLGLASRDLANIKTTVRDNVRHPKVTYLHHQLLVKIFGLVQSRMDHPLAVEEIKWLNGGLMKAPSLSAFKPRRNRNEGGKEERDETDEVYDEKPGLEAKKLSWSYNDNVVIPMTALKNMGVDAWKDIGKYDGWVLNTLFAKIESSMRMTKGFRYIKLYNEVGAMTVQGPAGESNDLEVWIGSIHPIFSLIQEADVGLNEVPNVVVNDGTSLFCTAVGERSISKAASEDAIMSDPGEETAAIRWEEKLLRAPSEDTKPGMQICRTHHSNSVESWIGCVKSMSLEDLFQESAETRECLSETS